MAGNFLVGKGKDGQDYFVLKAGNGEVILQSEGYKTAKSCANGIESVRKKSTIEKRFERRVAKSGKAYFGLKASNGQVVGSSQMYESEASRDNGIESVKNNAPDATVEDETAA